MPNKMNFINSKLYSIIYLVLTLLYVSLAMHFPVSIYSVAGHDDAWFISHAESILNGDWMGAFNQMTLIKGVGYSYFLILNNLLGTPITLTLAMLYVAACLLLIYVLRKVGVSKLLALCLFAFLIFQPSLFPTRIIRDNIYFSLFLIAISGLIYATLCKFEKYRIVITGLSGLCFGLFWITREEGVWVLPGFVFIVLYSLFVMSKEKGDLILLLKVLAIYFLTAFIPLFATGVMNQYHYGSFQVVDVKSQSFANVLNALNRVDVGEEIQFLPVPLKKREAIYKVSPAFRELEPYFEDTGKGWTNPGCAIYKDACGDYAGGWFMWALRDGTNSLGYYKTPTLAARYFERIADEINSACNNGTLSCANHPIPFMPRLTKDAIQSVPRKIIEAIKLTIYKKGTPLTSGPSLVPKYRLNEILDFLGNPKVVALESQRLLIASGWYYAPKSDWVYLNCSNGDAQRNVPINRDASLDIATYFKDNNATKQRFYFEISDFKNCSLSFSSLKIQSIKLVGLLKNPPKFIKVNEGVINFDVVQAVDPIKNKNYILSAKESLISFYEWVSVYIFSVGVLFFIGTIWLLISRSRSPDNLMAIAMSLWILYFSRIVLVVLVDVSSFPAINHLYLLPAFPIWTAASFVSMAAYFNAVKSMIKMQAR